MTTCGKRGMTGLALILALSACSGRSPLVKEALAPAPTEVKTCLSLASATSLHYIDEDFVPHRDQSSLGGYDPAAGESGGRRYALRALHKVSGTLRRFAGKSIDQLLEEYQDRFKALERRYDSVEDFVEELGVEQREFRQGLGITAATVVATLGTLHAVKPVAITPGLFGTPMRAGYDVSRLDDPRMMVGYADLLSVSVSKNGIGGTIQGERVSYTGDVNIRRMEVSANMTFDRSLSLGTIYAHADESVQGFVRLSF